MTLRHSLPPGALALAAAFLTACTTLQPLPPRQQDTADAARAAAATTAPQRNVTGFSDALRCMDKLFIDYGTRDVSLLIEDLGDSTKKVSAGTRDMMISAIADMTRRSRAIQVVAFGADANNTVAFLNAAQQRSAFAVVPQYGLRGSISQLDDSVLRRQADGGLSLGALLSGGSSRSRQVNVLGLDVALVTTRDLALVPGTVSKNQTTLVKEGDALDSQATISKVGINFSTSFQRTDGTAQALRNMVELSAVELFGRLQKLPYWSCLGSGTDNPEVRAEIEDWFIGMDRAGELTPYFQTQLRNRGFWDGAIDGQVTPALRQAVAAYRQGVGLGAGELVDLPLFTRFIGAPFPPPPAQPLRDVPLQAAAPAAPTAPAAPATAAGAPPSGATATALPGVAAAPALALIVAPDKAQYSPGEAASLRITPSQPAYVYCYSRDAQGVLQRIFPNRFQGDPRVTPQQPLQLPGRQAFKLPAVAGSSVACLAAPREVYTDVPAALRWGDFQALNAVRSVDELQRLFETIARGPVAVATLALPVGAAR